MNGNGYEIDLHEADDRAVKLYDKWGSELEDFGY